MRQNRLTNLAIISTELETEDLIQQFTKTEAQKGQFI